MKPIFYFLVLFFYVVSSNAQVGINTTNPDSSSLVDMSTLDKGLLIPRVNLQNLTDIVTIVNPANSLLVFNKSTINGLQTGYYYWSAPLNRWIKMLSELDKPGVLFATFDSSKTTIKTTSGSGNILFNYSNINFNTIIGATMVGTSLTLPPGDYIVESYVDINRDNFDYSLRINTALNGIVGTMATVKTQAEIVVKGQQAVFRLNTASIIDFIPLSNNGGATIPVDPDLSYLKIIKM